MIVARISVIVCTYNRAHHLRDTLRLMLEMDPPPDCQVEILVVDNNSTDNTREVVAEAARDGDVEIVYLHEARQGKSFALNCALARARGDVLALTDDDVWPAKDWLARIVAAFRERDVTFAFGKVLPRWGTPPPPELLSRRARDIWGPLAIVDYGDVPEPYPADCTLQRLPIGANVAFAAHALRAVGGWRVDLGKVNNTLISGEDHEIFIRLRRSGLYAGFYDPRIAVWHYVPPSRLTRRYFRRWFFWHGRTEAMMLDDLYLELDMRRVPSLLGVPRFLYRQAFQQFFKWAATLGTRDALEVLIEELMLLQYLGLLNECWRRYFRLAATGTGSARRDTLSHADFAK